MSSNPKAPPTDRRLLRTQETRRRILDVTRRALETRGFPALGMREVAEAAGITRAALYLHFPSKAELLLGVVEHVDAVEGLSEHFKPLREATDPYAALHLGVELSITFIPRIHAVARALDEARQHDEAADAAWRDRMQVRRRAIGAVMKKLEASGRLREDLSLEEAVDAVMVLSGVRLYDDLVVERGWSASKLVTYVRRVLDATIVKARR